VGLNSFQSPQTVPQFTVTPLTTQYRSLPPLGKLFSSFSYDGILKHNRNHEDKKLLTINGLALKEITIIKFPVNPVQSLYRPQRLEERSSYQIYSALFTVELALYLSNEITKHSQEESWKIGIICPYAAQATLVEKIIAKKWVPTSKVEIQTGTIHGFQGDECDIILDLLNPPPTISPKVFLNNQNILNVSISRARDYLILIVPEETEGLTRLKKLLTLIQTDEEIKPYCQEWSTAEIEKIIFQQENYIDKNCFVTTHQNVNVYSTPDKKYEVRCEDNAIDVQVFL
jgi:superfamily I DNA and/or RNA helicase